ncbi:MAG: ABC transporter ATP-binding protein, partial [Pseudomonadales bacterium]|nr:ABC transporter ATP-binding protein [Pseudomonadales bacterium]
MSEFHYIRDVDVDAPRDAPLATGGGRDRLDTPGLFSVAARTWPYIRPELKHLAALGFLFVLLIVAGLVVIGMATDIFYNHLINGDPLTGRLAALLNLDEPRYRQVDVLTAESRGDVRIALFEFVGISAAIGLPILFATLFYYMWIRQQINQNLRIRMMNQVQMLSLRFHANSEAGDAIYRVYQDSAMVTNIIQLFIDAARDLFTFFVVVITLYLFDPSLAGMLLAITICLGFLCRVMSSPMRVGFRRARETNSSLTSRIQKSVAGVKVVKANAIEEAEFLRFQHEQRRAFSAAYDARSRWSRFGIYNFTLFAAGFLVGESYMALLSFLGAQTYSTATVFSISIGFTLWNLGAFRFAVGRMGDSGIQALVLRWGRFQEMSVGLDRAFEILDLEPEVIDDPDGVELDGLDKEVRFDKVSFSYGAGRKTLTDIDFTARPGTITAIVGPTGAGKSTLMMLLLRLFEPDAGAIYIGGKDLRTFRLNSLREKIAIALQENILFSTSIRENIRYAVPDADDRQVAEAARITDAEDFILEQANGYDTELGERGARLSTGQRQRISIARAVLKDAPILILDEPTAALDAGTESKVMQNLAEWGRQRVIFLITHRLSTISQADQILYLSAGHLIGTGT